MRFRARWSGRTLVALVMRGLLLAALPSPALAGPVQDGLDNFRTFPSSRHSFTPNDILSGFFDEGSAPFIGTVILTGVPLDRVETGSADTVVRRVETARFSLRSRRATRSPSRSWPCRSGARARSRSDTPTCIRSCGT